MGLLGRWKLAGTLRKAESLERRGRRDEARALYESILETLQGRERVRVLSGLALCSLRMGRSADARKALEEAVALAPGDASLLLQYGRVCRALGDTFGAEEACRKAGEAAPDRPDVLYGLADGRADKYPRAALEEARRGVGVAIEFLEKPGGPQELRSLDFAPELFLVLIRNIGLGGGDPEESAAALRELAERRTGPSGGWVRPAALLHLGLLLANTGRYEEAVAAYRDALAADPSIHPARFNLAMAQARRHEFDEAERELRLYADRSAASPVVAFGRATIAEHRGDADAAVRHHRVALERQAESPVSPALLGRLDVPRRWPDYSKRFLRQVTGEGGEEEGDRQWVGPGKR